jgi:hypothetical protein
MKGFVGAAGTGKTYCLMSEVDAWLSSHEPTDGQCVLALSRMHGSRRRLVERLKSTSARQRFRCMTLDHFAWIVASRWRSLGGKSSAKTIDYELTSKLATVALQNVVVSGWIRARYPLIVIDELQDCQGSQLTMVQELEKSGDLLVAADEFQDLSPEGNAPAVTWLRGLGCVEELVTNHRTDMTGLLTAANAIRAGESIHDGDGLRIFSAKNENMAAKLLANQICWSNGGEIVVLSPTSPERSQFVEKTLARLAQRPFKDKRGSVGPYRITWHGSTQSHVDELRNSLGLPESDSVIVEFDSLAHIEGDDAQALFDWLNRKRRLGQRSCCAGDLRTAIQKCVQQSRSWGQSQRGLWGTTIHGAKNREFERVVILWPYQAQSGEQAARLLYNAVTRAKKSATIIIQDPSDTRAKQPPFTCAAAPDVASAPSCQLSLFDNRT